MAHRNHIVLPLQRPRYPSVDYEVDDGNPGVGSFDECADEGDEGGRRGALEACGEVQG